MPDAPVSVSIRLTKIGKHRMKENRKIPFQKRQTQATKPAEKYFSIKKFRLTAA